MVISYDNFTTRLWLNVDVLPFMPDISSSPKYPPAALLAKASSEIQPSSAALAHSVRNGILSILGPPHLLSPPPLQEELGSSVIALRHYQRQRDGHTEKISHAE